MFKIASFNANSIRARLGPVLEWLDKERPDVLCLQETKVQDSFFPASGFNSAGYNVVFRGQKSYNGVAIASPHPIEEVDHEISRFTAPGEARIITAVIRGIHVVNTYAPQGQNPSCEKFQYKINWFKGMRKFFESYYSPETPLVWAGDFNVAPEPVDVYDPDRLYGSVMYHPEEHKALQNVKEWGFTDVFRLHVKDKGHYTFWDYRWPSVMKRNMGWRIDHIWATPPLAARCRDAWIDRGPRLKEKPSDHTFIAAQFDW